MKCPKCEYLGFDTGERCRNCGYDFSLMAAPEEAVPDLALQTDTEEGPAPWLSDLDKVLGDRAAEAPVPVAPVSTPTVAAVASAAVPAAPVTTAVPGAAAAAASSVATLTPAAAALAFEPTLPSSAFRGEPALPLFSPDALGDDEPMIKVAPQPRPPLAVRRTPETPRLRAVPKAVERPVPVPEPELDFADQITAPAAARPTAPRSEARNQPPLQMSGAGARVVAAAIDHAILFAIDAAVIYLTLRIAALSISEWAQVPMLPMATFLGLLKLSYFTAFTCVGGQTIGKMAVGIRVVGDDHRLLDAPHAVHRALAGAVSFLTFGLGFLPALFASDHRALHDRLAKTRVVVIPGA